MVPRGARRLAFSFALAFSVGLPAALLPAQPQASNHPYRMFEVGSPILEDFRFICRESGVSILSLTPPLSADEVLNGIDAVDQDRLSSAGRAAFARILDALRAPAGRLNDGALALDVRPNISMDLYGKFGDLDDWIYDYGTRRPFVDLPVDFFFSDLLYASSSLSVAKDPDCLDFTAFDDLSWFYTNLPESSDRFDLNLPRRGYLSVGGPWWSFQLGRSKLSFGEAFTGNMAVSDNVDYHDYGRLSLFSPNFKYSLVISQMPLDTADLFADGYTATSDSLSSTTQRYFYYHRWDLRLFEKLSISLGEACMVGDSPLELRFLNPLAIYHGFFSWDDYGSWSGTGVTDGDLVGSMLSVDIGWSVVPSFSLYGQFIMNEYSTEYEKEHFSSSASARPNGLGWLGGAEWVASLWGRSFTLGLEGVYADPYLYDLSSPFASYIWMRRTAPLYSGKELRYLWIGHPLGRDFVLAALKADLVDPRWKLSSVLSYALVGEHSMDYDYQRSYEAANEVAPTGTPERRLELKTDFSYSATERLTLSAGVGVCRVGDAGHVSGVVEYGLELTSGMSVSF